MKKFTSKLDVYILSRNRAAYLKQCINSVLANNSDLFHLTVSDNSDTSDVREMVKTNFPRVRLIGRSPILNVYEHFNKVISESNAEFLIIFHDDDLMMPNFIEEALTKIESDGSLVAVGHNAFELHGEKKTYKNYMKVQSRNFQLSTARQLLWPYLTIVSMRAPPFPGYIYRRSFLDGIKLDPSNGGKYCDVSFLLELLEKGSILWCTKQLMYYRFHQSNDTKFRSIAAQINLCNYLIIRNIFTKKSFEISNYKFKYHMKWILINVLQGNLSILLDKKYRPALKFVITFPFNNVLAILSQRISKVYKDSSLIMW